MTVHRRSRLPAWLLGVALLLSPLALSGCRAERPPAIPVVGVKIYEHQGDLGPLFASFEDLGINTLFVGEGLAANRDFRDLARRHRMPIFVILPVFYDSDELDNDPALAAVTRTGARAEEDWVAFVCPSRDDFRARKLDAVAKTVTELQPEGVSLDFIRFFAFWEMIRPDRTPASIPNTCFCPSCLAAFAAATGVALPDSAATPQAAAAWIEAEQLESWTAWKCGVITSWVDDLVRRVQQVRPGVLVNVHAVPWRRGDFGGAIRKVVGQDFAGISRLTDYLSPMCYSSMLHRDPAWIASVVQDLSSSASCPILPSIQVRPYYPGDLPISTAEFEACLSAAVAPPSRGVVFWSWPQLAQEPEKMQVIRRWRRSSPAR